MPKFRPSRPIHLYNEGRPNRDSALISQLIAEQIEIGGVTVYAWLMEGYHDQLHPNGATATPLKENAGPKIQDAILMETRDRKYSDDAISLRGAYRISEVQLDFNRWGIQLAQDTVQMEFHREGLERAIGRRLEPGDVLEVPHLRDVASDGRPMNRFYEVKTVLRNHLAWDHSYVNHVVSVTMKPIKDSQEFIDLMERETESGLTLGEQLGSRDTMLDMTSAVQSAAKEHAYTTWWDTKPIYMTDLGRVEVWLDDGQPPNGTAITGVSAFPPSPSEGDYALRVDFVPNRLFRYVSGKWILREVDRKREWNNYNWTDALAGFMTDRTEEQDMRPWEYRSIHDVATVRQDRFSPSPKSDEGYPPLPSVGGWEPMITYQPPSFGYIQADDSSEYSVTLPGGTTGAFLHPALEAPSGAYSDFYVQYTASRSTGQEVGELVVNDTGALASLRQEVDTIGTVGITFSVGHSLGQRYLRYTTTAGPSIVFKFRVRRRPNTSIAGVSSVNDIFEVALPVVGSPDADETLLIYTAAHGVRLEPTRSFARAVTPPLADSTFRVYRNGTLSATFTFLATSTTATVSLIDLDIAAGDVITVRAPASADPSLADVGITLGGFRTVMSQPASGDAYELTASAIGSMLPGELLMIYTAAHDIMFEADRCFGRAITVPTSSAVFTAYKNGVAFATMTFAAGSGSAVVAMVDGSVTIGDTVTIRAPATADATLADVGITLGGFR